MERTGITREGWVAAGLGAGIALGVMSMPFAAFALGYIKVLTHEMGHALAGWLYGYPSIPAFDFVYGGGVTSHGARWVWVALAVQAGLLWLAWLFFRNRVSFVVLVGLNVFYALTAWTGAHDPVILAMGHGTELVIAGLFLHRAFSGRACHHAAERVTYAFVGWFVTFENLGFARGLVTSAYQREIYENAKGGGHWMDFSRLAEQHLHVPLEAVAVGFFVMCLAPPVLAFLGNHYHALSARSVGRLREV
jgi:hypothetical protein